MKKLLVLTFVFVCCCFALQAQVTQAEYFIDTDPGPGSATSMTAADGSFDGILETAVQNSISISGVGFHSINIRVKDVNGNWGPVFKTIVHVDNVVSVRAVKITQAELFFDSDPGQGNGTAMVAFDGNYSDAVESVLNNSTSAPASGMHKLSVRVKDVAGNWGPVFSTAFKVDNLLTTRTIKVAAAELFWDTDPGQGNGTALLAFDGNYSDAVESLLNNTLTTPSLGLHKLSVRVKDVANTWGPVFSRVVHVENTFTARSLKISSAELFWDTDPGQGSGTAMLAFDGNYSDAVESVLNNTLATPSLGLHKLNVRVKDLANTWGPVFSTVVHIENAYTLRSIKIISGEMFFDTDPGQGAGIAMVAFDGNYNDAIETVSQNWSYLPNPGYHSLSVRVKDVAGAWSPVFTVAIHFLPCTSQPTPVITSAGNINNICPGDSVLLTASGTYSSYTWFKGNILVGTGASYYAHASGFYQVYVTDGTGCPGYSSFFQITETPLLASITPSGATTFCQGGSVLLNAGTGYASYNWSGGQSSSSITVTASGVFTVTVSNGSCSVTSDPVTVTVNPSQTVPTVTTNGPTAFCMGQSVTLTSSVANSYYWSTGAVSQSITVNQSGNYTVTAYNMYNCSAVSTVQTITVDNPVANITPSGPTTFCQGDSVTLTVNANNSYLWNTSASSQSILVNQSGTYSVVITDALGCTDSALSVVTVNPNPPTPTITVNSGNFVSSAITGNQWYLNGVLIAGATGQTYTFTQNGVYTVVVTNGNGCSVSSASFNMTSIGLAEVQTNGQVSIYPNPFSALTNIQFNDVQKNTVIKITDVTGREIKNLEQEIQNVNTTVIDMTGYAKGVYFVNIINDKREIKNIKLVLN